jgi:hypothetical protein
MTACATPPAVPPAEEHGGEDGGDPFLALLNDVLVELEEMRKVCAPDVADMSVDLEVAHQFTLFAINNPSRDAFIRSFVKASRLLPEEGEEDETLRERVQKALAALLGS